MALTTIHHAQRYLFPALTPPDASELQQATAALEAKYDEAAQLLEQLKTDSESVKATVDRQNDKVDGAVDQLTSALEAFQTKEKERDEEFQKAKEEIDALRELLNQVRFACRQELCAFSQQRISIG